MTTESTAPRDWCRVETVFLWLVLPPIALFLLYVFVEVVPAHFEKRNDCRRADGIWLPRDERCLDRDVIKEAE